MRRFILSTIVLLATFAAHAVEIHCQAGKLSTLIAGKNITELKLTGQMDARDFKTIATQLRNLTRLDLTVATIVPYSGGKPLFANLTSYRANEVPSLSLAQMLQLTTLSLPGSATSIGEGAMAACTSLTSITLPVGLTHLGNYALAGCTALPTIALPMSLECIGEGAFTGCTSLSSVTMSSSQPSIIDNSPLQRPAMLREIGARAFAGCSNLKSVSVGFLVQSIGEAAFAGTQLSQANLSDMTHLSHIGDWAYAQARLTSVHIPSTVTSLGWGAFVLNPQLSHVVLSESMGSLSPLMLAGNNQITAVDLNATSIDSIGAYALYNLNRVTHLTVPASTRYVGTRAMAGMTGLQQVTSHAEDVPQLGEDVWQNVDQPSVVLKVPANSLEYYRNAEQWREFDIQSSGILGDVNGDGQVDIADVNAIINYMLGHTVSTFVFDNADIDQSGGIDIADINGVINLMLGHSMSIPATVTPNTGDALAIDNFAITTGERHTIDVHLNNSHTYTALQCVIHLPDGLQIIDGTVTTGDRASHHTVASLMSGNEVRIVLYSLPNDDIEPSGDAVLRLTATATESLAQMSDITIDHVVMVTADGDTYYAPTSRAQVSKTSGVAQIDQNNDRVYAANGTLHIVASQAGQAQVVAINGSTRTLHVDSGDNSYHNIAPGIYIVRLNGCSYKVKI